MNSFLPKTSNSLIKISQSDQKFRNEELNEEANIYHTGLIRPCKEISCFPSRHASLLESPSRKILFFITLTLKYLELQLIVFLWKQIHFVLHFNKNCFDPVLRSTSMIEIHISWYEENVKLFLSEKSQFAFRKDKKIEKKSHTPITFSIFRGQETIIFYVA